MQLADQLLVLGGILLGISGLYALRILRSIYRIIKLSYKNNKLYNEKKNEMKEFKEKGNFHEWVDMAVQLPSGKIENTHVCKNTGYCPKIDGFVPLDKVKMVVDRKQVDKEFQAFKKIAIKALSFKYHIPEGEEENLYNDIVSIKKDFHIYKMEQFTQEIKEKFGKNVKVITDINELGEFLEGAKDGES